MKKIRGLGRIYQRGTIWWVQYSHRGIVRRESSGRTDYAVAVKLLKKRLGEIGRGKPNGQDEERVTFKDLCQLIRNDYKANQRRSLDQLEAAIIRLTEFFGSDCRAVDISTARIRAYIALKLDQGAKPATIRNQLAALKSMFRLALEDEKLTRRPHFPTITVSNARQGFFEDADFRAMLGHLPEEIRPVAEFGHFTGWRKSEVLGLTWDRVDFQAGVVRLEPGTTKNDEGRTFPFAIFPPLADLLRRQWDRALERQMHMRATPWVFCWKDGRQIRDFRACWEKACEKAGCPDNFVLQLGHAIGRVILNRFDALLVFRLRCLKARAISIRIGLGATHIIRQRLI